MNKTLQTLIDREFIDDCTDMQGLSDLMDQGPIAFYLGTDPTAESLHIGHMVPFFAMHHMQLDGHKPVALVGGGTALIGDPSGKTELRKMISAEQINKNAEIISKQLATVIDFSENPENGKGKAVLANNADWLVDLNYIEFLRDIGRYFSVNKMLTFEGVKQRLARGLSFIEFNYQLLQSYDYHVLNKKYGCRLQIGGTDQWGNIVAGQDLIGRMGGEQCYGLTFKLVKRADGAKMGKSEKGAVFLNKDMYSVFDYYQYWRNVNDEDVIMFMKKFTFLSLEEIAEYAKEGVNINDAKERLAFENTKIIHGEEEAIKARDAAKALFAGGGNKDAMPTVEISKADLEAGLGVLNLYVTAGLVKSNSEARTLVMQGGAEVNGEKITDPKTSFNLTNLDKDGEIMLKAGKKKFCRILVK